MEDSLACPNWSYIYMQTDPVLHVYCACRDKKRNINGTENGKNQHLPI